MHWKLCYMTENFAWFATVAPDKVRGDDWNDAPIEANAEPPHVWEERDGPPKYALLKVGYDGPITPNIYSPQHSVDDLNRGRNPWATSYRLPREIYTGTSLTDFWIFVECCGGKLYFPA